MGQRNGGYINNSPCIDQTNTIFLARHKPFEQITALTNVAEGTIVRVITRLDETCREIRDAARVIGDAELFKKMEEAQVKIKRDSECRYPHQSTWLICNVISSRICCKFIFLKLTVASLAFVQIITERNSHAQTQNWQRSG